MLSLYDPLKSSYLNTIEAEEKMKKHNYKLDHDLSNIQTKVFYNPEADNPLLITYRGTKNILKDVPTDIALAFGQLKHSSRYKDSKYIYQKSKEKYNSNALLVGHSLGGSLASAVSEPNDKVITFNKGSAGIISPSTETKANETAYRWNGDVISGMSIFDKHQPITIGGYKDPFSAHHLSNIEFM
jgi:hypothetical protein